MVSGVAPILPSLGNPLEERRSKNREGASRDSGVLPCEVGRTQAASAGARNIVTVFDCDVDVKTGGRPRARSERRRAAAS